MPTHRMHITALELAFSRTATEIHALQSHLRPLLPIIAAYTYPKPHRARLIRPMISHDLSAFALSFLPASGEEPCLSPPPLDHNSNGEGDGGSINDDDKFTYHHLRRDLWDATTTHLRQNPSENTNGRVDSRYVVPSAHITLGRFLSQGDHATPEQRKAWVEVVEEINQWLEEEVWDRGVEEQLARRQGKLSVNGNGDQGEDGKYDDDSGKAFLGEWAVGQEKGLDVRVGTLWYGGGRTIASGEGF